MSSKIKIRVKIGAQGVVSMQDNTHLMAILGQRGIKVPDFIKDYNEKYKNMTPNITVNVIILVTLVNNKKTYEIFSHLAPSVSELIKNKTQEKTITYADIVSIAQEKMQDLNCKSGDLESAIKTVTASVKSAGLTIIKENN